MASPNTRMTLREGQLMRAVNNFLSGGVSLNINKRLTTSEIQALKNVVALFGMVIIKRQKFESKNALANFMGQFGKLYVPHGKEATNSSGNVVRLSNDRTYGKDPAITSYKHSIHNLHYNTPGSLTAFYMHSKLANDETRFMSSQELVNTLEGNQRAFYELLYVKFTTTNKILPLISGSTLNASERFIVGWEHRQIELWLDFGDKAVKLTDEQKYYVLGDLKSRFDHCATSWYVHKWEEGDVIIMDDSRITHDDNLNFTRNPFLEGKRIVDRLTVEGENQFLHVNYSTKQHRISKYQEDLKNKLRGKDSHLFEIAEQRRPCMDRFAQSVREFFSDDEDIEMQGLCRRVDMISLLDNSSPESKDDLRDLSSP